MKNKMKKLIALSMAATLSFSTLGVTAYAENLGYGESNSYALNFGGQYGTYFYEYTSPCNPLITYTRVTDTPYTEWVGVNRLYNTLKPEEFVNVYCVDEKTNLGRDYFYQRVNLEDSDFYTDDAAELLRAIVLNGFPSRSVEDLAEAAGVEGLTKGEAINATQLAIWKAAYGDELIINEYVSELLYWCTTKNMYSSKCTHHEECLAEQASSYNDNSEENLTEISERVEAVFEYLMNLEPVSAQGVTVSDNSFVEWSDSPVLTQSEEQKAIGTYDVTVSVKVNVVENTGDDLKLSAVLGEYYTTVDLGTGEQAFTLTIKDVPAATAYDTVTLAIDGTQTVTDVYMYEAQSKMEETAGEAAEREEQQRLIGYSNFQLPVHAEIKVEPERVLRFKKLYKTSISADAGSVATNQTEIPLSGITFDLYLVADYDDYITNYVYGDMVLPKEIDVSQLGDSTYHYPDYTVITDAYGEASISLTRNNLPDGVYVVAERANAAVKAPVKPFYVMIPNTASNEDGSNYWEYEILVQPKNEVIAGPEIRKDVIEIEHEDKSGAEEQKASAAVGEAFTWIIRSDIPVDMADAKEYVITDELDYRLTFVDEESDAADDVVVKVETVSADADKSIVDAEGNAKDNVLVKGTDYVLTVTPGTVNIDANGNTVTDGSGTSKDIQTLEVKLTAAGMDKAAKIAGAEYENYEIRVYFNTMIDSDAVVGEEIPNDARLDYVSSVGFRYKAESDDPSVYTCGIKIYKYNAKNEADALGGAEFKLAKVVDKSNPNAEPLVTPEGVTIYVEYVSFYDNAAMIGDKKTEVTTTFDDNNTDVNEGGLAYMYGLEAGEYYLIETKAPTDYNLLRYPIKVELDGENTRLASERVANSNAFVLPETGGIGTLIFKICGVGLIAAAVVVLIVKKKKEKEDEEE